MTDDLTGVALLTASVDSGAPVPVKFDSSGNFTLTTALATDGSADGQHTVSFTAVDRVNNATPATKLSFVLDTKAPAITVSSPASGGSDASNVTVTGKVTDAASGVATLTARLDSARRCR